jgi:hypothetical protein
MALVFDNQPATIYPITVATRRKLKIALEDDTAANELVDALDSARSNKGQVLIDLDVFKKGVNAPADSTIGTTPTTPALLFTLANQVVSGNILFPTDVDRTQPITMRLEFSLAATQSAGDTLDITADYIAVGHGTGNGYIKASTQLTSSVDVTTDVSAIDGSGLEIGDVYHLTFDLQPDNALNPLGGAESISFEFHMTNVLEVESINFVGASISYFDAHPGPTVPATSPV